MSNLCSGTTVEMPETVESQMAVIHENLKANPVEAVADMCKHALQSTYFWLERLT